EAGANAVAINPGVFVPSTSDRAVREPPLDIEGEARVLDRPLWGKMVQYLEDFSAHEPDRWRWGGMPLPLPSLAPEGLRRDYAKDVIDAAQDRGLKAYVFLSPTILPGLSGGQLMYSGNSRDDLSEFQPVRVDGSTPDRAIAGQGCLNNPAVKELGRVTLLDA